MVVRVSEGCGRAREKYTCSFSGGMCWHKRKVLGQNNTLKAGVEQGYLPQGGLQTHPLCYGQHRSANSLTDMRAHSAHNETVYKH